MTGVCRFHCYNLFRLSVVESYVLPMLTYACETHNLCSSKMRNLSMCWNNFQIPKMGVGKTITVYCGRLDFNHLVSLGKLSFWSKVRSTENRVLFECGRIFRYTNCFNSVCPEYNIEADNFPAQCHAKQKVYIKFEACVFR